MAFANDHLVNLLSDEFTKLNGGDGAFFSTVVFENTAEVSPAGVVVSEVEGDPSPADDSFKRHDVSMNWYLTAEERKAIERAIPDGDKDEDEATQKERLDLIDRYEQKAAQEVGNRRLEAMKRLAEYRNQGRLRKLRDWWGRRKHDPTDCEVAPRPDDGGGPDDAAGPAPAAP